MKIGIIVHSQTGNTFSVAEKVREKLAAVGYAASIERIAPAAGTKSTARDVQLESLPDVGGYDALVFAGPVQGASPSRVIASCLTRVPSLAGKRVACFVTQGFPFPWMGGNTAIAKMKSLCAAKRGTVSGTWVVNWSSRRRAVQIDNLLSGIAGLFQ